MVKKPQTLSDQIRAAINAADESRYRICKETDIAEANLSRFMAGKSGLSLKAVDRLGEYLKLEIVVRGKPKGRRK